MPSDRLVQSLLRRLHVMAIGDCFGSVPEKQHLNPSEILLTFQDAGRGLAQQLRRLLLGPDWRQVKEWKDQKGYLNPQWGPYREIWHLTREAGESALIPLMVDKPSITAEQTQRLREVILQTDYLHNSSCGIIYHLAAYWKARRYDML